MRQKYKKTAKYVLLASLAGFLFSFQISSASQITRENVVDLVNNSRVKEGVGALVENSKLNQAAMEKAKDMIQNNYFAHTSPQNVTPWFWFEKNGYDYRLAGENLAINFQSAEEEHEAWMESETHKKNILNPKYQEIGVAVERGMIENKPAVVAVQMFGAREDFKAVLGEDAKGDLSKGYPDQPALSEQGGAASKNIAADNSGKDYWIYFSEMLAALLIVAAVGSSPIVFGWLFVRSRRENTQDTVYPIKLVLIK